MAENLQGIPGVRREFEVRVLEVANGVLRLILSDPSESGGDNEVSLEFDVTDGQIKPEDARKLSSAFSAGVEQTLRKAKRLLGKNNN